MFCSLVQSTQMEGERKWLNSNVLKNLIWTWQKRGNSKSENNNSSGTPKKKKIFPFFFKKKNPTHFCWTLITDKWELLLLSWWGSSKCSMKRSFFTPEILQPVKPSKEAGGTSFLRLCSDVTYFSIIRTDQMCHQNRRNFLICSEVFLWPKVRRVGLTHKKVPSQTVLGTLYVLAWATFQHQDSRSRDSRKSSFCLSITLRGWIWAQVAAGLRVLKDCSEPERKPTRKSIIHNSTERGRKTRAPLSKGSVDKVSKLYWARELLNRQDISFVGF